jgi:hypothetical protein
MVRRLPQGGNMRKAEWYKGISHGEKWGQEFQVDWAVNRKAWEKGAWDLWAITKTVQLTQWVEGRALWCKAKA